MSTAVKQRLLSNLRLSSLWPLWGPRRCIEQTQRSTMPLQRAEQVLLPFRNTLPTIRSLRLLCHSIFPGIRNFVSQARFHEVSRAFSSVAASSFSDAYIDISDLGLRNPPVVIPTSTGWLTTLNANNITRSGFDGSVVNWSTGTHSGYARYLVVSTDL